MEQKQLANNQIIAQFMGLKHTPAGWASPVRHGHYGALYYHKDWQWLMTVVEKITNTLIPMPTVGEGGGSSDTFYFRTFGMKDDQGNYLVRINCCGIHQAPKLIDAVFQACLDFIQNTYEYGAYPEV